MDVGGLNLGSTLREGRLRVLTEVGRGAMGTVYRAYDADLHSDVALKVLHELGPGEVYRLKQEFRILRGIVHPNLVRFYELDASGALPHFTMEFLEGTDLLTHVLEGGNDSEGLSAAGGASQGISFTKTEGIMKRSEKEQIIAAMKQRVERAKSMFFADFTGITVEQVSELRREFRKSNVEYQVVKNTLARKALAEMVGYDTVAGHLHEPTAIAFGFDDPVAPARIIRKFREKNDKLRVKVCVLENRVYDGAQLDEIAKLPTRKEIIAGVLGCIQAPVTGVVGVLNAVIRDLVSVIDAIEKKKAA